MRTPASRYIYIYISIIYFSLFSPVTTAKNSGHYRLNKYKKTLEIGEKKDNQLGILELRNDM